MEQSLNNSYISCDWVEGGLEFRHDSIRTCCFAYLQDKDEPYSTLIEKYNGEKLDWDTILEKKRKHRELHKKNQLLNPCKDCVYLLKQEWPNDFYIDHLTLNHWSKCDCNCSYCYTSEDKTASNNYKHYDILPVLEDMFKRKILRATPRSCVTFGGGEPTILENFDKIIELFLKNGFHNIRINSSGIKYSKSIEKGLKLGAISLVISPDSGTKKMYEKIKRVNCFDKVWDNIKKYSSIQGDKDLVKVKYIIIPGLNDTKEEMDKWFELVLKSKAKSVSVSVEQGWYHKTFPNFSKDIYEKVHYITEKAKKLNLNTEIYIEALSMLDKYKEEQANGI